MPSSDRPPEFFIDRSLGRHVVPDGLRALGLTVRTLVDVYGDREETVLDEEWLHDAGLNGWIVLTKDDRLRYNSAEREALIAAGVRVFCLTNRHLSGAQQLQRFTDNINRIIQRAEHPGPFIYGVYERRLQRLYPI